MADSLLVVCPQCTGINRVPEAKLQDGAKCGKCREPLFSGKPIELTQANFAKQIKQNDLPIIVDFWAPWCGPCKMMAPVFEQAAQQLQTKLIFAKLNTEAEQTLAGQHNIRSIPTLAIFKQGKETNRSAGAMDLNGLIQWAQTQI